MVELNYEFTECLNPILARVDYTFKDRRKEFWNVDLFHTGDTRYNKAINIIGNMKFLSKKFGNSFVLNLLSEENVIKLPCRHCINCKMKRSKEWSTRCALEGRDFSDDYKWFITLTYDDFSSSFDYQLHVSHLQSFFKRLRAKFPKEKIRYFACGEYGSITCRPHYHILLYGITFKASDLEKLYTRNNNTYYKCKIIEDSWKLGQCIISNFSDYTAFYTAQYTTKKASGKLDGWYYYHKNIFQPEFQVMSRNPGIAKNYYDKHKEELYQKDYFLFHIDYKTTRVLPFKFYDNLYDLENPEHMNFIKENRKLLGIKNDYFLSHDIDIPIYQYLNNVERINKEKRERLRNESIEKI